MTKFALCAFLWGFLQCPVFAHDAGDIPDPVSMSDVHLKIPFRAEPFSPQAVRLLG